MLACLNFGRTFAGESSRALLRHLSFLLAFHLLQCQLSSSVLVGVTNTGSRQHYNMATIMEGFRITRSVTSCTKMRLHYFVGKGFGIHTCTTGINTGSNKPHTAPRYYGDISYVQLQMLTAVRTIYTTGGDFQRNEDFHFYRLSRPRSPLLLSSGMIATTTQRWSSSSSSADASAPKLPVEASSSSAYEHWVRRLYQTNMFNPVKLGLTNIARINELLGSPMDDVSYFYE